MPHPSFALQKAIYAALVADAGVGALIGDRIYDASPRNAIFPYVSFGRTTARDWSTGTEGGAEHQIVLHVWSRERGKKEAFAVMAAVEAVLHDATLPVEGHALANLRLEFAEAALDPDGLTYHGVMRFRAVTEAA